MKRRILAPLLFAAGVSTGSAQTIIDDWANVTAPPPPELKPVTLDPRSAALLLLDFNGRDEPTSGPCNTATKPRCLASIPKVRELLDKARAKGVLVVYSLSQKGAAADIQPEIAPAPDDPVVASGPNKFLHTRLRDLLAEKSIRTVVVAGTAAEGAVLDTGTDAALHGMSVVVPVDTMSSTERYAEQYVAWHFTHAPGVSARTILTRVDLLGF